MAKRRRKDTHCLNCLSDLNITDSFCPQCGQENTNNKVSLTELVKDIISNYFNLDTRFGRAIIPFLFKPGSLTVDFNLGHRLKYMHPLKLYIMMSLIYFFIFSWFTMPEVEDYFSDTVETGKKIGNFVKNTNENTKAYDSLSDMSLDSAEQILKALEKEGLESLDEKKAATLLKSLKNLEKNASSKPETNDEGVSIDINIDSLSTGKDFSITDALKFQMVLSWLQDREMTPERFLDSLGVGENNKNPFTLKMAGQALKIGRNDPHIFAMNLIDNIPVMMLFLLPILAMYLKLIYIRSSKYYIEHLIFTLHIQAFIYFIFALGLLAMNWLDFLSMSFVMGILIFIYSFAMFLRVYQQNWFKTFIKMHILAFLYFFSLVIFLCFEVLVSFFIF